MSAPIPSERVAHIPRTSVSTSSESAEETITECEALRYGYLRDIEVGGATARRNGDRLRVLVLGEFRPSATVKILHLLEEAALHLEDGVAFTVKPHPNVPVHASDYPSLPRSTVQRIPRRLFKRSDLIGVDASLAWMPVVVRLDDL